MDRFTNRQYIQICKSYNVEYARNCNKMLDEQKDELNNAIRFDEAIINNVRNSMNEWIFKPISREHPDITIRAIIDGITNVEEVIELACYAAVLCDDDIPDYIKIKLGSFGTRVFDLITNEIESYPWSKQQEEEENDENNFVICSSFIKLLADWECVEKCETIVSKFYLTGNPHELIADAIRYYLVNIDNEVTTVIIIKYLNESIANKFDFNSACEYMLIALTDIGKENHSESIYFLIKTCFRKMSNRVIGAICLGDYGDGRGVQVLKGWLDSHPFEKDRQLLCEIMSSIKRLGGDISDIQHRMKLN